LVQILSKAPNLAHFCRTPFGKIQIVVMMGKLHS